MSEAERTPEVQPQAVPEEKQIYEITAKANPSPKTSPRPFPGRFVLGMMALIQIFQSVWIFSGKIYYRSAVRHEIYAHLPAMRILDWALALALLAAAVLELRNACSREQKHLPLAAAVLPAAVWPVYGLGRFIIAGLSPLSFPIIGQTLVYAALLAVNMKSASGHTDAPAENGKDHYES